jgi:glucosamine 6-phosphate synthetase-like amidotransferase/phosphosugar isomerase protein
VIENQEIIHFDGQDIKAYQVQNLKSKKISFHKMDQQALEIDKGNYAYFMLKEIYEQQESLTKLLNKSEQLLPKIANKIESSRNIYVVGAVRLAMRSHIVHN